MLGSAEPFDNRKKKIPLNTVLASLEVTLVDVFHCEITSMTFFL